MQIKKEQEIKKTHLCCQKLSNDLNFVRKEKMFLSGLASLIEKNFLFANKSQVSYAE